MPLTDELARLDATAQAQLVRRGALSPLELVDAAIARIERLDGRLGALSARVFDEARAAAACALPDGPFRGVPFLMKDLGATQVGLPYTAGNAALHRAGHRAASDTYLGARFRNAGLVTVGVSKTPEFGLQSTTQPLVYGPACNPWDPSRTPGGSSGGACAAVASGMVPLAHANDGAGSIRIPAAWCGLVGFKPSRGRIALEPGWISRSPVGFAVARSLRDAAVLLDAVSGSEAGDLYRLPPPARLYLDELVADPASLRVGLLTRMPGGKADPECIAAAESAAELLDELGHRVELSWPEALLEAEERSFEGLVFGPVEYRLCLRQLARMLGRAVREDDVEPYLWTLADPYGPSVPAEDWLEAAERQQEWVVRVSSWWHGGFDVLVTPTVGVPPPRLAELDGRTLDAHALLARMGPHMAFAEPFNVTGHPALSLPLSTTADGLPLGVQLVARVGREDLLLRLGAQIERARPWSERTPPVFA